MTIDQIERVGATEMDEAEIAALLEREGVGVLALNDDPVPYLLPMSFGYDGENALYFVFLVLGERSRKVDLSDRATRASFLVYTATSMHEWQSVMLTGTIDEVSDEEWSALRNTIGDNAWHPSLFSSADPMQGIRGYRFEIEEASGIKSESTQT